MRPDLNDRFQGGAAVRGGIAPRMPYSEVERRFAAVDSTRTMPGDDSLSLHAPPHVRSEQQQRFVNPGPQPRHKPEVTLRILNDIGSSTTPTAVPATQFNATQYELGTSTESRARAQAARDPRSGRGRRPPSGPIGGRAWLLHYE